MTWLQILSAVLHLAVFLARRAERQETARAVLNEIEILQGVRTRAAADARERVRSGQAVEDPHDPYRRD